DLYYRLAVLDVRLPALRERLDDLPMLVDHILEGLEDAKQPDAKELFTPEFVADLARHSWPGNVRELRNYLERCLTLRRRLPLPSQEVDHPADVSPPSVDTSKPLKAAREQWTRTYLEQLLRQHDDNIAAAARAAGIDRVYLYRLLERHGLR